MFLVIEEFISFFVCSICVKSLITVPNNFVSVTGDLTEHTMKQLCCSSRKNNNHKTKKTDAGLNVTVRLLEKNGFSLLTTGSYKGATKNVILSDLISSYPASRVFFDLPGYDVSRKIEEDSAPRVISSAIF